MQRTVLLLLFSLLLWPAAAAHADSPTLSFVTPNRHLAVGEERLIELHVAGSPPVYGIESHLLFDPTTFEVVDADPARDGVQLIPGSFIDPAQGFIIQNQADNTLGTIDYALTLLNPAPSVEGDGVVVSFMIRAKGEGVSSLQMESSLLGTRTGEAVQPTVPAALTLSAGKQRPLMTYLPALPMPRWLSDSGVPTPSVSLTPFLVLFLLAVVGGIGLIRSRRARQP